MIAFATLFLGLVLGVRPVTLIVGPSAATVEVELDGRSIGRLTRPPWTLDVDFGPEFEPHELTARAINAKGEEIGRSRQWINLPRPPAEAEFLLERDARGVATHARLTWASIVGPQPIALSVTFDGRRLELGPDRRAALPVYDPESTHVLSAELGFENSIRSRTDLVLGGGAANEAKSDLTAIPVSAVDGDVPPVSKLQGWFVRKGTPLSVVAVEAGPADVLVVRDLGTEEAFRRLAPRASRGLRRSGAGGLEPGDDLPRDALRLEKKDRIRVVWPVATRRPVGDGTVAELFETSRDFTAKDGGVHWLLTRVYYPVTGSPPRRFADAVAVAGLHAFSGYSRRAVVLVLGESAEDRSRYAPDAVARYLERLRVPLVVWSLSPPRDVPAQSAGWSSRQDISSPGALERAVRRLRRELENQAVVWVEGRHLPQEIELSPQARGLALLR